MQKKLLYALYMGIVIINLLSCHKFLDKKQDNSLVVPTTLDDLQAILDNNQYMNTSPFSLLVGTDDYYITNESYNGLDADILRQMYIWDDPLDYVSYFFGGVDDWSVAYKAVYYCNTIIENIEKITVSSSNQTVWNNIKGQALFQRGRCFYEIASLWSPPYDSVNVQDGLGIPLRLSSDFNTASSRPSVKATYDQIIADLKESILLLPNNPTHVMRPSKCAVYGELAKVYLSMNDYKNAFLYSDSCLQTTSAKLLDYNTLDSLAAYPFASFNQEVIFHTTIQSTVQLLYNSTARIDSTLMNLYTLNDLRKSLFYGINGDGSFYFKGDYSGGTNLFTGLAIDEIYLIKAESAVRNGDLNIGLSSLNTLLSTRIKTGTFVPLSINDKHVLLDTIVSERRKELLMRGTRWTELRRLNKLGYQIQIQRKINNIDYLLKPNDLKYTWLIPKYVIDNSNIEQNKR